MNLVKTGEVESTTVLKRLGSEDAKKAIEKVIAEKKAEKVRKKVIAEKKAEKKQSQRICRFGGCNMVFQDETTFFDHTNGVHLAGAKTAGGSIMHQKNQKRRKVS